jgi:hypothetical protein
MMNNLPEEDPKLLNFLRQHRSIAPPPASVLEDRLMSEIDLLPQPKSLIVRPWRRYIIGGIGLVITGVCGIIAHQIINPSQPSMAELQQLNLYLEAHIHDSNDNLDVDLDLFTDNDSDGES